MKRKIKQRDITDCGAACLASVAAHYMLNLPVAKIRQWAGTDKKGTNAWGIVTAAKKIKISFFIILNFGFLFTLIFYSIIISSAKIQDLPPAPSCHCGQYPTVFAWTFI